MSKVIGIFAHPDDEVLGCGASLSLHKLKGDRVDILIMATGLRSRGKTKPDSIQSLQEDAYKSASILGIDSISFNDFPDNAMDTIGLLASIKVVEEFINSTKPDIIYTHHFGDLNIDHRIVYQAVVTALRPCFLRKSFEIRACEVNSSTEWNPDMKSQFAPTIFQNIAETIDVKLKALEAYKGEIREWPHSRSVEGVRTLAKYRGFQSGLMYAEAFIQVRRIDANTVGEI